MRLVIFDIDGTLTNTLNVDDLAYLEAVKEICCIDINDAEWQEIKSVSTGTDSAITMNIYQRYFFRAPKNEEVIAIQNRFYSILNSTLIAEPAAFKEIEGASGLFKEIQCKNDYNVAIATGCWKATADLKLSAIGINTSEIPMSTADDFQIRSDIVKNAVNMSKKFYKIDEYDKIYYVGDGHWDFAASQELGLEFIGIDYDYSGLLGNLGADRVINDFLNDKLIMLGFIEE